MDREGLGRTRQKLIAPLIIQGLANWILVTDFRRRPALEALNHNRGFNLGFPCPSVHGGPPFVLATVYSVPTPYVLTGSTTVHAHRPNSLSYSMDIYISADTVKSTNLSILFGVGAHFAVNVYRRIRL